MTNVGALFTYYNERGKHLERLMDSLRDFDFVVAGNGRWPFFPDSKAQDDNLSWDGSTEVIKSYDNAIVLDHGHWGEIKSVNACMKKLAQLKCDWVLQVSADEYVTGDIERFVNNANDIYEVEKKPMYLVQNVTHRVRPVSQKVDMLPRLHHFPMFNRLRYIHWWWYNMNQRAEYGNIVYGLKLHHDDTPRTLKRERQMAQFQKKQAIWEKDIMDRLNKIRVPKPTRIKLPCGCISKLSFTSVQGKLVSHYRNFKCTEHATLVVQPIKKTKPRVEI